MGVVTSSAATFGLMLEKLNNKKAKLANGMYSTS
eukprot:CAMPEP_0184657968 /NCGR_PEP_ID=MMETSP0308-20130426/23116_1 /TAXON_ID=38269 /ORGANISM="Gloeochaete witrockiana, Strain SAG 46.84" /LENGTH=33 /DNA_ID= /DNA_START= /DNA_END= /DNA_ORIENTATION=